MVDSEVNAKNATLHEARVKLTRLQKKFSYDRTRLKQAEAKTKTVSLRCAVRSASSARTAHRGQASDRVGVSGHDRINSR
ncbi:MAG: hypothetical protein GDA43_23030 [Hormoscilla sp. SP5CHS1]|nr:hypothetical protein [Hormoscilla sp. SP12CHS1]MBC6455700.1 hypothetical protein [Hormoscilla sp. SP5CHS1]